MGKLGERQEPMDLREDNLWTEQDIIAMNGGGTCVSSSQEGSSEAG